MKHALATLFVLFACFAMGSNACTVKPQFIVKTAPAGLPSPGTTVTLQVTLNQPANGTQAVSISAWNRSHFSSIPTSVNISNGETTATFQATLATNASGFVLVEASCNGHTVSYELEVQS